MQTLHTPVLKIRQSLPMHTARYEAGELNETVATIPLLGISSFLEAPVGDKNYNAVCIKMLHCIYIPEKFGKHRSHTKTVSSETEQSSVLSLSPTVVSTKTELLCPVSVFNSCG